MIRAAALAVAVLLCGGGVSPSFAQDERPAAKDTAKIEACLKAKPMAQESCIGIVADPCLESDQTKSTADQNACAGR